MVKFEGVTLGYNGKAVIDNFSCDLSDSKITAITGPSGCGKTTLLSVAAGIIKPEHGRFVCDKKVSVMFQEPRLFPWLTALQNVNVVLEDSDSTALVAKSWLEKTGLTDFDKYPSQLSGGMKQRVSLARALAYDSQLLLLDEPFSALDDTSRNNLLNLLLEDWRQVVFVTHNEADTRFADKIIDLK